MGQVRGEPWRGVKERIRVQRAHILDDEQGSAPYPQGALL